jgi:hypothetical protein
LHRDAMLPPRARAFPAPLAAGTTCPLVAPLIDSRSKLPHSQSVPHSRWRPSSRQVKHQLHTATGNTPWQPRPAPGSFHRALFCCQLVQGIWRGSSRRHDWGEKAMSQHRHSYITETLEHHQAAGGNRTILRAFPNSRMDEDLRAPGGRCFAVS